MATKKTLLIIPGIDGVGGVASYYKSVLPHLETPTVIVTRGTNRINLSLCKRILAAVLSYWYVLKELLKGGVGVVQVNTSLDRSGALRDALFIVLAWAFRVPVVTFIRGWHPSEVARVERNKLHAFRLIFLRSTLIILLSSAFAETLRKWGYKRTIYVETTAVNEELISASRLVKDRDKDSKIVNILFLARVEREKGIYEAMEAFALIEKRFLKKVKLVIAGSGPEIESARNYADKIGIHNIVWLGYVKGRGKAEAFLNADIYLFPSYHEGMPNSLLEAMLFGLPIVTTSVGGLKDFFEEGKMGHMIDNPDPALIAEKVDILIEEAEERRKIGNFNAEYAGKFFRAKTVAKRMERIWETVMCGTIEDGGEKFWWDSKGPSLLDVGKERTASGTVVRDDKD